MTGMTRAGVATITLLLGSPAAAQQPAAPNLTKPQRAALQAVVAAVDQAASGVETPGIEWPVHLLRTSDGSHYVAFTIIAPPGITSSRPIALYVRLTTKPAQGTAVAERSAVAEWLAGHRTTLPPRERGIVIGEMPTFGAGAIASRAQAPQDLRLLERDRERARERREEHERERKAALQGEGARATHPLLPFEDFDVQAVAVQDAAGNLALQRSFTAGPGDYELTVGWTDPSARNPGAGVAVVKRALRLPIASTTAFGLSNVIVADQVLVRETPFTADQQTAHPYAIGTTEVVPARDQVLTTDEGLVLFVQVINPRATFDGKPDIAVGFRVLRTTPTGQELVGSLKPQIYDQTTLPADFDVAKGHPIFAAVQVPLRTFKRGAYRMEVLAEDRLGGVSTTADATFTITGTPAAMLRDAPPLGEPFRRAALLEGVVLEAIVGLVRPPRASAALTRALAAARERRFVDLVREDEVGAGEQGGRAVLRALALFALGDTPAAIAAFLRQAQVLAAPPPAVQMLIGASRALEGNQREAIAAWHRAVSDGMEASVATPLLIDAYLRQGDGAGASALGQAALAGRAPDAVLTRRVAAACISAGRLGDAMALLERRLQEQPDDEEAQWLLLHALFAGLVRGEGPGAGAADRERFRDLAKVYVGAGGRHAALASEWSSVLK